LIGNLKGLENLDPFQLNKNEKTERVYFRKLLTKKNNKMKKEKPQFTPDEITKLPKGSIFVFGSNLNGKHTGGAAKTALEKFGAIMGQATGLQGQSYAIPTLDKDMQKLPLESISESLDTLISFAKKNPKLTFYFTKIGTGIAGFNENKIAKICLQKEFPKNIIQPERFTYFMAYKGMYKDEHGYYCSPSNDKYYFEVGKKYTENSAFACKNGFHACEEIIDVNKFYAIVHFNVVAEVKMTGCFDFNESDKVCASKIEIVRL